MHRTPRERQTVSRERRPSNTRRFESTKLFGKTILLLAPIASLGSMALEREPNPVLAINNVSLDIIDFIEGNTCPKGPEELGRSELIGRLMAVDYDIHEAYAEALHAGLSFADPTEVEAHLAAVPDAQSAVDFVSAYTEENFGFGMELEAPVELFAGDEASSRFAQNLQHFTRYTSMMPRELLREIGLDSIHVVDNSDGFTIAPPNIEPGSARNERTPFTHRTMYLHHDLIGLPSTFIHEGFGHILQYKLCGTIPEQDEAFTRFNPEEFSYGQDDEAHPPEFVSDYATTNVHEDFAETAEEFASTAEFGVSNILPWSEMSPAVLNKTAVVMHRIDSLAPGAAAYMAEARLYFADLDCTVIEQFYRQDIPNC